MEAGPKPRLFAIWPVLLVEFERMKKRGHILLPSLIFCIPFTMTTWPERSQGCGRWCLVHSYSCDRPPCYLVGTRGVSPFRVLPTRGMRFPGPLAWGVPPCCDYNITLLTVLFNAQNTQNSTVNIVNIDTVNRVDIVV